MRLRSSFAVLLLAPAFAFPASTLSTVSEAACCKPTPHVHPRPPEPISFDELPLQDAITIVRGGGTRRLAVFQDPDCVYSKRLEKEVQLLDDVTVHVFLFPVRSDRSRALATQIWCAPERSAAWRELMLGNSEPPTADDTCETPIDDLLAFGKAKQVRGTPTLIFENGDVVAGALAVQQIEERLRETALVKIARSRSLRLASQNEAADPSHRHAHEDDL